MSRSFKISAMGCLFLAFFIVFFVPQSTAPLRAATNVPTMTATLRGAKPALTQPATAASTMSATASTFTNKVSRIAFVANRNGATNIYSMDPDGKNIAQLTNTAQFKMFSTWSPDGKLIAYLVGISAGKPPLLMVMNANGGNAHQLNIGKAVAISPPAWSPDSKQIAYISVRSRSSDSGLYIIDVAANREQKLETSTPINFAYMPPANAIALTDAFAPSWSPDGTTLLLFGGLDNAAKTTLLVSLDGTTVRPFFIFIIYPDCMNENNQCVGTNASWSPAGDQVLFVALQGTGQYTRVSIDVASEQGVVTSELPPNDKLIPQFPVWSPDGKQIAFTGLSFSNQEHIYVMNADGSDVRNLTDDTFSKADDWPSWGMVPSQLVKR